MKKNYLLILGLGLATFSFGQTKKVINATERKPSPDKAFESPASAKKPAVLSTPKAGGDVIYSETFASIGSWTTTGANAAIWEHDTDGPNGEYSSTTQRIQSATVSDGFMIFDCDKFNTPLNPNYVDVEGQLVSPIIDISALPSVTIRFTHAYRTCCSDSWFPAVEVSTDGFATFQTYDVEASGIGVNDNSNTITKDVNITAWMTTPGLDLTKFQFRFNFDGVSGATSHYFWQIDDVQLIETYDNDLEVREEIWGSTGAWGIQQYYLIPESQRARIEFQAIGVNNGSKDQIGSTMTASTSNGEYLEVSDEIWDIAVGTQDTFDIVAPQGFIPAAGLRTFDINLTVSSGAADATPANNTTAPQTVTITKHLYGADNDILDGRWNYDPDPYEIGNVFQIFKNETLYAANVNIATGSTPGTQIYARLYNMDLAGASFADIMQFNAETQLYTITSADAGYNWVTIPFDTPISLDSGSSYTLVVGSYDAGFMCGLAGKSYDYNSVLLDNATTTWYYVTSTPAIRMNFDPTPFKPTITASGNTSFCAGGSVTLFSSFSSGNVWSTGETTEFITVTTPGDYTVTANGLTSEIMTVTVNALPTAPTITPSTAKLCAGGTVNLSSSNAVSYMWSTGESTQSINITAAGTYDVTISDGQCSNTSSINIVDAIVPTISAAGATTFCQGGSVVLTSSVPNNNTWSSTETTQSILVNASGSYTVSVADGGCNNASAPINVTVNPAPDATLGTITAPTACGSADGMVDLAGTATGDISWTGTDALGNPVTGSMTAVTLPTTLNTLLAGSYVISMTDASGCAKTINAAINDPGSPAPPTITASAASICGSGTIDLTASVATDIQWSTGEFAQTITVSAAGSYSVRTGIAGACVSNSDAYVVVVNPLPTVNAGSDVTVCAGEMVNLTGTGAATYSWDNGISNGVDFAAATTTTYTVTGTDFNGCSNTDQVIVSVNPLPNVTAGTDKNVCLGSSASLTATGAGTIASGASYLWSTGETTTNISVSPNSTTTYSVMGTDANGCSNTANVTVTVDPLPVISFTVIPQSICYYNGPINLSATPAGGTFSGTGVSGNTFTPFTPADVVAVISYTVTVNNCTSTASQNIYVDSCLSVNEASMENFKLYPNPNGGSFVVSAENLMDFDVINVTDQVGRLVGTWAIENNFVVINMNELAAGNYNVAISGRKGTYVKRVVLTD